MVTYQLQTQLELQIKLNSINNKQDFVVCLFRGKVY